jgi:hypothetical protein
MPDPFRHLGRSPCARQGTRWGCERGSAHHGPAGAPLAGCMGLRPKIPERVRDDVARASGMTGLLVSHTGRDRVTTSPSCRARSGPPQSIEELCGVILFRHLGRSPCAPQGHLLGMRARQRSPRPGQGHRRSPSCRTRSGISDAVRVPARAPVGDASATALTMAGQGHPLRGAWDFVPRSQNLSGMTGWGCPGRQAGDASATALTTARAGAPLCGVHGTSSQDPGTCPG